MTESSEELAERLEKAALDAREAAREAHEARTDLRTIINEANAETATSGSSREACETDAILLCPV